MAERIPGARVRDAESDEMFWQALRFVPFNLARAFAGSGSECLVAWARLSRDGNLFVDQKVDLLRDRCVAAGIPEHEFWAEVERRRARLARADYRELMRRHIAGFPRRLVEPNFRPRKPVHRTEGT
jgi:hypothetical protein